MSVFPVVTPDEAIRVIKNYGFTLSRQSGSHMIFKNKLNKRITIPYHAGKTLHPKIVKSIIETLEISIDEFKENL
ncbi:type II toxin-antitoxin system HicA family toxin [Athalassotoga saccharophila]|uniref:type II toxin-antitoxin system HicA family toxin n=1 Tax=Athalassotoga saccharophila TaxID=1441386 RepID=UPI001379E9D8|nr:type II toxin-antitoxin system HicA family toxin [Athalassotoga saccharophila]BBJ27755.1 YcfA-like protein [Athalassotoga saccharophila]